MRIEYGMGVEYMQIALALGLMLVNVLIFIDRRPGMNIALHGAPASPVAALALALPAFKALQPPLLHA